MCLEVFAGEKTSHDSPRVRFLLQLRMIFLLFLDLVFLFPARFGVSSFSHCKVKRSLEGGVEDKGRFFYDKTEKKQ